ncbi:MAG: LysM peptidoglycan-binding domain-containing protein [Bacteroidales bacterium]|nr:LysM peptidoglycan-binding domain-containing protein [Bacteroidales bacterium]
MRKLLFFILMLFMLPLTLRAQQLMACRGFVEDNYDFWLYLPDNYEKAEELPLVMFLHGKSLSGDSLEMVLRYGSIDALLRGRRIDAIVAAPQTPEEPWDPEKVIALYDWLDDHYKVDTNRFYVLGMSMGGWGTLNVASRYPDRIAAAMAMCGGLPHNDLCGLCTLPLWIIHGTADELTPVSCSDRVVDSMRSCGDTTRLIYDRLEGENHGRLARIFYLQQTYDWLFSHSLLDEDRPVNRSYSMSTELINEAYNDMDAKFQVEIVEAEYPPLRDRKKYHIVKRGESLAEIAVENYTTVSILCKLNNFKKTVKLWPGRKIRVK